MSCCSESVWIRASTAPKISATGSQRYTLTYLANQCTSESRKPSKTDTANTSGPRIESTIR